ncbi:Folylpolyglutamate synthase [Temnothorax longispinosus]|uniref:Folylpolyglutamate synthase n=1 Tax=Temnothorax longispinosus TaxID=300112 RepID=A0A4V3SCJ5_9HYME|nr:Folylpolyglutamate synthase [Temnothorax longispinosus]
MITLLRRMTHNGFVGRSVYINGSYEEAIKALNLSLQSNAAYLQSVKKQGANNPAKLKETEKYLLRSGITLEQLDSLSVIHVAGTKGKGTTCAFTEAILRQHGFSTGFFSSPHLVSVRERIRLNGEPISQSHFARSFWTVYRRLEQKREHESDMPTYFKFLTILMFHVFLEANVDVAIIEVGIGGELDSTNILRNPVCVGVTSLGLEHTSLLGDTLEEIAHQKSGIFKPHAAAFTIIEVGIGGELDSTNILRNPVCVGVTSLGLEHTSLLGDTLEEIAHQKSGIFKPHAAAFTVQQPESAMRVLQKRAIERRCRELRVVSTIQDRDWNDVFLLTSGIDVSDVLYQNALLAVSMALEWMKLRSDRSIVKDEYINSVYNSLSGKDMSQIVSLNKFATALANCKWPGRTQILETSVADFFLDGAHTIESIVNCVLWFKRVSRETSNKFLIFNTSGDRNSLKLLNLLKPLNFDRVYFAPNYTGVTSVEDLSNYVLIDEQKKKCKKHRELWGETESSILKSSVAEVIYDIKRHVSSRTDSHDKVEVLVTGSLHMVGAVLAILDPNLTMTSDF